MEAAAHLCESFYDIPEDERWHGKTADEHDLAPVFRSDKPVFYRSSWKIRPCPSGVQVFRKELISFLRSLALNGGQRLGRPSSEQGLWCHKVTIGDQSEKRGAEKTEWSRLLDEARTAESSHSSSLDETEDGRNVEETLKGSTLYQLAGRA